MHLLNCDKDGVPNLVQRAEYRGGSMMWVFHLFNGVRRTIWAEEVPVQGIDLMTMWVTPEMQQDAINWFNERWQDGAFRERMEIAA